MKCTNRVLLQCLMTGICSYIVIYWSICASGIINNSFHKQYISWSYRRIYTANEQGIDDNENSRSNISRINVLLNAKYRTGSTFASEFLHKNRDFMYFFEPLSFKHTINDSEEFHSKSEIHDLNIAMLENMFNCNIHTDIVINHMAEWSKRAMFCQIPDTQDYHELCSPVHKVDFLETAQSLCHSTQHRAAKVIRLHSLSDVSELIHKGMKVVQLLRDPRGVASSRSANPLDYELNLGQQQLEQVRQILQSFGIERLIFIMFESCCNLGIWFRSL